MQSSEGYVFVRPDLQLYYKLIGDQGPTLVVPNANWLANLLLPLAESHRLLLYDPRGRGRSSAVTDGRRLSLEDDVADLEAVRRDFGLGRFSLLGASYHAAVTTLYALDHPQRVERMLLVCPITPFIPGEWAQELPAVDSLIHPPGIPRLAELRKEAVDREDPVTYCRAWFNYFLLPAQMGELAAASHFPLDEICSFPNEWPQATMRLYFRFIVPKMGPWDFRPRLGSLALPLLVIQGTDDLVPTEASRQWVAHAGNSRFLPIEGAGHHPYIERPVEFFAAARSFLAGAWPEAAETLAAA